MKSGAVVGLLIYVTWLTACTPPEPDILALTLDVDRQADVVMTTISDDLQRMEFRAVGTLAVDDPVRGSMANYSGEHFAIGVSALGRKLDMRLSFDDASPEAQVAATVVFEYFCNTALSHFAIRVANTTISGTIKDDTLIRNAASCAAILDTHPRSSEANNAGGVRNNL